MRAPTGPVVRRAGSRGARSGNPGIAVESRHRSPAWSGSSPLLASTGNGRRVHSSYRDLHHYCHWIALNSAASRMAAFPSWACAVATWLVTYAVFAGATMTAWT
jgi:hypothetical protein